MAFRPFGAEVRNSQNSSPIISLSYDFDRSYPHNKKNHDKAISNANIFLLL